MKLSVMPYGFSEPKPQEADIFRQDHTICSATITAVAFDGTWYTPADDPNSGDIWFFIDATVVGGASCGLLFDGDAGFLLTDRRKSSGMACRDYTELLAVRNVILPEHFTTIDRDILRALAQRYLASIA